GGRGACRQIGHRRTLGAVSARTALVAPVAPVEKDAVRQEMALIIPAPRPLVATTVRAADGTAAADIVADVLRRLRRHPIAGHLQRAACTTVGMFRPRHAATQDSRQSNSKPYENKAPPFHGFLLVVTVQIADLFSVPKSTIRNSSICNRNLILPGCD